MANRARDVHGRAFLADRQTRGDRYRLFITTQHVRKMIEGDPRTWERRTRAMDLMLSVANDRYPLMMKPAKMHLISEMPEPAA